MRRVARAPGSPTDSPAAVHTPRSMAAGKRGRLGPRSWLMSAILLAATLAGMQLLSGFQHAEASADMISHWISRKLSVQEAAAAAPLDRASLTSSHTCVEAERGQPEQRVCIFENIVVFNGRIIYISDDPGKALPAIKISWLKKFEGDDFLHPEVLNRTQLPFAWEGAAVEEVEHGGLFHQTHYSNFYHMFSEVAPTVHNVLCKHMGECNYNPTSNMQLLWIEEHRQGNPDYIMLDSIKDTFRCITPLPVLHKDNPVFKDKVLLFRKAVVGVGPEVRVFHNWEKDLKENWREPPAGDMLSWRQRVADCFGFNFTQQVASTNPMRILFINRHYEEGRMILNAHKIAHKIKQLPEFQAFPNAELEIHYLEGEESIRYQAELFWNASMLIWPHGATMAHTIFLPRGAQAIEVVPWVQKDKANLPEWVQAIRDAFSLEITLYDIQNQERPRAMFNQDKMLEYNEYRQLTPEQKIALLEQGECPAGVWDFLCPFWWNHWKVSVNFNWDALKPLIETALRRLADPGPAAIAAEAAERHKKLAAKRAAKLAGGGNGTAQAEAAAAEGSAAKADVAKAAEAKPAAKAADATLQQGGGGGAAARKEGKDTHNRSLSNSPPVATTAAAVSAAAGAAQQQQQQAQVGDAAAGEALLGAAGRTATGGTPLSDYKCAFDNGKAENRLCVFTNLLVHGGKVYYVAEDPASVALPDIQIAWEDWTLDKNVREDKFFSPQVVAPSALPFKYSAGAAETVERAGMVHAVDSGNFYHLVSEVQPTFFANWCSLLGLCSFSGRKGFQLLFIHPDPKHYFGVPPPAQEGFNCLSDGPVRNIRQPDVANSVLLVEHGVVGIGPYMRAYERQEFRKAWQDPPPGVMTAFRHFLSDCTGTGFADAVAPSDPLRVTFINRPYSSGRMFLNLPETLTWIEKTWLPEHAALLGGREVELVTATLREEQPIAEQIDVLKRTSLLVYPHGATMTHAMFLPRGAVALEVIQWPNVTEPHGWLQSIRRQYEMKDLELLLMVNSHRDHLVLNWHALAQDDIWRGLSAEEKVALQETGACPADKEKEARCFFDWLHWRSNLVLNRQQLGEFLGQAFRALLDAQARLARPGGGGAAADATA